MKDNDNQVEREVCQTGNCGVSMRHIWLGIAVIIFIMAAAIIFGN